MYCNDWLCGMKGEEVFSGKNIHVYKLQGVGFRVHCMEGCGDPESSEMNEVEARFGRENIVSYFSRFYRESELVKRWLTSLPCLKSFESLWNDCMDSEYEQWLASLTNLEEMMLRSPHSLMEAGVKAWSGLKNLKRLKLWEFGVENVETFYALGQIKSLEELIVDTPSRGCKLGKEILSTFEMLPNLRKLGIGWWCDKQIIPAKYVPPATVKEFVVNGKSCGSAFVSLCKNMDLMSPTNLHFFAKDNNQCQSI